MTKKLLWPYEIGRELGVCAATVRRLADAGACEVLHRSSSTKIQLIAIRRIGKGTVRAIADVGLGSSRTLKEFKVIQQPGQWARVSPPS